MTTRDLGSEMVAQLRKAIQESNQSLNQLSGVCGVDRGRLSRFVRGERDLTLEAAAKLCEALGLTLCTSGDGAKPGKRPRKSK